VASFLLIILIDLFVRKGPLVKTGLKLCGFFGGIGGQHELLESLAVLCAHIVSGYPVYLILKLHQTRSTDHPT
jgi:hypothetical protein